MRQSRNVGADQLALGGMLASVACASRAARAAGLRRPARSGRTRRGTRFSWYQVWRSRSKQRHVVKNKKTCHQCVLCQFQALTEGTFWRCLMQFQSSLRIAATLVVLVPAAQAQIDEARPPADRGTPPERILEPGNAQAPASLRVVGRCSDVDLESKSPSSPGYHRVPTRGRSASTSRCSGTVSKASVSRPLPVCPLPRADWCRG